MKVLVDDYGVDPGALSSVCCLHGIFYTSFVWIHHGSVPTVMKSFGMKIVLEFLLFDVKSRSWI